MDKMIRIAIDGPAAAGKSTVAKIIAEKLKIVYVDTGAMYRALTYKALEENIALSDEKRLADLLKASTLTLEQHPSGQVVLLDGKDVTAFIRSSEVSNSVSEVAGHKLIREEMVARQKEMAANKSVVMDGRDIGTHVLPEAEVKIFLMASVEERAERRHKENLSRGFTSDLQQLKAEIEARDKHDMNRKTSPLVQAEDAIALDTTSMTIDEVARAILDYVQKSPTQQ